MILLVNDFWLLRFLKGCEIISVAGRGAESLCPVRTSLPRTNFCLARERAQSQSLAGRFLTAYEQGGKVNHVR
jgi:hypothetical protein